MSNQNPEYTFSVAEYCRKNDIIAFMRAHWGSRHPLVELPPFFHYYYEDGAPAGTLRFALAEESATEGAESAGSTGVPGKNIAALAGYFPSNTGPVPDIWVSIWLAAPHSKGAGLELMDALPRLTGCRTLACNNIRPETRPFYEFLGYTTGRMEHWYRTDGRPAENHRIAQLGVMGPACDTAPPPAPAPTPIPGQGATLALLPSADALRASGFVPPLDANPYKDLDYIIKRYYSYPQIDTVRWDYMVYAASLPDAPQPAALLVTRTTPCNGSAALRIVDYIGPPDFFGLLGSAIGNLLQAQHAEYADIYCAGLPATGLAQAGFTSRAENAQDVIIPHYLEPLLRENVEYYYFTSRPDGFTIFRADGDQDRPNIKL